MWAEKPFKNQDFDQTVYFWRGSCEAKFGVI